MPSFLNDGAQFFPNVLKDASFQANGILFGKESVVPGSAIMMNWCVVDPRRHTMTIWEKKTPYFDDDAKKLGASVVTNGSFNEYRGGSKVISTIKVGGTTGIEFIKATWAFYYRRFLKPRTRFSWPFDPSLKPKQVIKEISGIGARTARAYQQAAIKYWTGSRGVGHIIGKAQGISEKVISRPTQHFFGRKTGRNFSSYLISQGDPAGVDEAIGGLFRTVKNYQPVDPNDTTNQWGFWGLAPMTSTDAALKEAGIDDALEEYHTKEPKPGELPACDGLIITVFTLGKVLKQELVNIRVKDAVRVDGASSVLMGKGATLLVGNSMIDPKRLLQKWGFQFQKG